MRLLLCLVLYTNTKTISSKIYSFVSIEKKNLWQIIINPIIKTKPKQNCYVDAALHLSIPGQGLPNGETTLPHTSYPGIQPYAGVGMYMRDALFHMTFRWYFLFVLRLFCGRLGIIPIFSLLDFSLCVRVRVFTYLYFDSWNSFCFNQFNKNFFNIYIVFGVQKSTCVRTQFLILNVEAVVVRCNGYKIFTKAKIIF